MDQREFGQYVRREYDTLLRFVKSRVHNAEDAEDLLQKTILKLLLNCADIHPQNPGGYFFTALRTAIIDYWRKRGRRPPTAELPEQVLDPNAEDVLPSDAAGEAEERVRSVLHEAVGSARLTERQKRAFSAWWKGRGDRTTALRHLGLGNLDSDDEPAKQERYRVYDGPLFHAKKKLAQALQPDWDELGDLGYYRIWELVDEVICGSSEAAL